MLNGEAVRLVEKEHFEEPILVEKFLDIKIKPDIEPTLEEFKPLFDTEDSRLDSFEEAKKAFLYVLEKDKIQTCLEDPKINKKTYKFLKKIRRIGLILRAQYKFLDKGHNSPKKLQEFITTLGSFNDQYYLEEKTINVSDLILTMRELNPDSLAINIADKKDFHGFGIHILKKINNSLDKPQLSMVEFHKLRRSIRFCGDLLQVAAAKNYGGKVHWLFSNINEYFHRTGAYP